jgi:3',5'-cyclic AMP phosphodiesterase CpdA
VPIRVLHVSDLHVGTREDSAIEPALLALVGAEAPELVVASGDLTHRGREAQHARATAFLRGLGMPVLAVPGNHDIPYSFPARFTQTFTRFERHWETTQPVYRSESLLVIGLNSVRAWRRESGGVNAGQLERARQLLAAAGARVLRVVVLHHHLVGAPWRTRKKPVARRSRVLAALVDAGAELVLAGHVHQGAVSERREFEVVLGGEQAVVVSTAPGLGQPRPRRRGESRGLHVYDVDERSIGVRTFVWRDGDWALTAERRFARGREPIVSFVTPAPAASPRTPPA